MQTQNHQSPHTMLWIAGIAVILFCAAGIAAIMGWIPTSTAGAGSSAAPVAAPVQSASSRTYSAPARNASSAPARSICTECGIVESTREISEPGKGSGIGGVRGEAAEGGVGLHGWKGVGIFQVAGGGGDKV